MNELIKVAYDNDCPTVSGRDLHEFLEVSTKYADWFHRMCEYGFSDGVDYFSFLRNRSDGLPGKPLTDHQLTIDMAKELCMIQRNEKGKQARQYFLQLERDWNSPEKVMARALKIADKKILYLESENARQKQLIGELKPKADYVDTILRNKGLVTITQICDNALEILLRKNFLYDNYASQVGKGTDFGLKRLDGFMHKFYRQHGLEGWVLKCDIRKYFYSIPHEYLKRILEPYVPEEDVRWLLWYIIDSTSDPGIPIGNQSSQLLAVLCLSPLDHFIKEKLGIKYYGRYMDDFYLIHEDKE